MKTKKSIYILLPIVLLIWGAVVYQFFSFTNNNEVDIPNQDISVKPFKIKPKDTFSIQINKRDPFLGKITTDEVVSIKRPKSIITNNPAKVKEELIWPNVEYKGIISDNKDKIKVYMLIINGKTFLMKKGEEENEVKLKEGDREMVYVVYKGDLRIVIIQ